MTPGYSGISFKGSRPALVSISYSRGREDGAVKGGRKRLFKGSGLKQWESDLNTPHTLKDISSHSFSLSLSHSLSLSLSHSLSPAFHLLPLSAEPQPELWTVREDKELDWQSCHLAGEAVWRSSDTTERSIIFFLGFTKLVKTRRSTSCYPWGLVTKKKNR